MRSFKFINYVISFNMSNQLIEELIKCMSPYITESYNNNKDSQINVYQNIDISEIDYIKDKGNLVNIHSKLQGYLLKEYKKKIMLYKNNNYTIIVDFEDFNNLNIYIDVINESTISELTKIIRFKFLYHFELNTEFIRAHCAVFYYKNKGILLIGNRGSGKTSFLLNALKSKHTSYVTNDKALIHNSGKIYGLPYAISIPKVSLKDLPEIDYISNRTTILNKYLYWPIEFCNFFNTKITTNCPIDYIFLTKINFKNESIKITKKSNDITKTIFSDIDKNAPYWLCEEFNGEKKLQPKEGFSHLFKNKIYEIDGNPWKCNFISEIDNLIM